nr:glycosyltransferase [Rhodoligotrophos defluvii]
MIMHVITNYSANAGAETMLSRLLTVEPADAMVVSLRDVSPRYRAARGDPIRHQALGVRSLTELTRGIRRLARLIHQERPAAILCWMYHAMVAGTVAQRLSGVHVPVFWNVRQSLDDPRSFSRSTRLAVRAARHLSHLPSGIIFNSSRSLALHRHFGFRNGNMTVIPNGFGPAMPVTCEQAHQPRVFGIAARLHPQKDHATFFRAAAQVYRQRPEARFVAVGAGLEEDNAEAIALRDAAGLPPQAIDLRGETQDMGGFYRAIDVLVLSSRTEGFPNVVAEAMSFGKPVVTTDVGDAAAIVGDTGIVVAPGDSCALAEGMCRMLDMSAGTYRQWAAAARKRIADHYGLPEIARRYAQFLGTS